MPAVFQRYVFAGTLSNFSGDERRLAWQQGYRTILVQLGDGTDVAARNEIELQNPGYRNEGWQIAGWGATYTDPEAGAQRAIAAVHRQGLVGYVTNWEVWGEGPNVLLPGRWLAEWNRGGAPVPLGLSCLSSENDQWARSFLYAPWVAHGATIMPQVYGDDHPGYTVHNMRAVMKLGGVPEGLLAPTFGAVGPNTACYADYKTWPGPRGLWIAGQVRSYSAAG